MKDKVALLWSLAGYLTMLFLFVKLFSATTRQHSQRKMFRARKPSTHGVHTILSVTNGISPWRNAFEAGYDRLLPNPYMMISYNSRLKNLCSWNSSSGLSIFLTLLFPCLFLPSFLHYFSPSFICSSFISFPVSSFVLCLFSSQFSAYFPYF